MEPDRTWTMRELAREAEVSLGLASMVTTSLVELQAAVKTRKGLRVHEPGIILDAWSQDYDVRRSAYVMYRSWLTLDALTDLLKQRGADESAMRLRFGRAIRSCWSMNRALICWRFTGPGVSRAPSATCS